MNQVFSYFDNEALYPALDVDAAVSHLSDAIRCRTVNYEDHSRTDFSEFDRLQALMRRSFPSVMAHGQFELIGHAVLITVPGSEKRWSSAFWKRWNTCSPTEKAFAAQPILPSVMMRKL